MSGQEMPVEERSFPPGVPAAEALQGLPVAGAHRLEGARITAVTATTLRAALDLLLGETLPRRPLEATWDDGALEVRCPVAQPEALALAGGLMETIEGSLGAPAEGRTDWVLRVPVCAIPAMYLMLEQGTLSLAIPWHAVIRVRMVAPENVAELARREGSVVLQPFVGVPAKPEPRPVVLIGLGLKRAYLIADRLIWRMPAEPVDQEAQASGLPIGRPVRTLAGQIFWAVETGELLANVDSVPLPKSFSIPTPPVEPEPPAPRPPLPIEPALQRQRGSSPPPPPPMRELLPEEVEPLADPIPIAPAPLPPPVPEAKAPAPAPPAPAIASAPEPPRIPEAPEAPAPTTPAPSSSPRPRRRALIAEDSIIGRIFLARLLERRGFTVESVVTARELEAMLARGPWDLVLADVELPDASRGEHLLRLGDPRWVALVRDRDDEALAADAGVTYHLRKPFESEHLDHLLPELGFGGQSS